MSASFLHFTLYKHWKQVYNKNDNMRKGALLCCYNSTIPLYQVVLGEWRRQDHISSDNNLPEKGKIKMKKIISLLLVLCMVLGMSVSAFAASDSWDGTADTSWYNDTDTEFTLTTAEQLAGFGKLVDEGNTFEGKTVKLGANIDLYCAGNDGEPVSFNPIGYGYNTVFKGTFDGQDYVIDNLYQNGWALGYAYSTEAGGLFASVVDATIKNLTINNAKIVMECVDMGILVGYSYGNCTYENIYIANSTIANYQRYTGGVVGEVNGTQTFKNVDVGSGVTVSSLWGDFDCSLGGIVGGKYGDATLTFEDCDVACTINAYSDVTSSYQWYAYRRAGMLIGNSEETTTEDGRTSATASYLTTTNCTVTYYDWTNYTYCEFAGTSWPYVRVQGSEVGQCSAYSNPRYGVATDANGNKAVDEYHVHNEGEDHFIPIKFDQLFGGGQGTYGTLTHDGTTVTYSETAAPEDNVTYKNNDSDESTPPAVEEDTTDDSWYEEEEDTHTSSADIKELIEGLGKKARSVIVDLLGDDDTIGYSALKVAAEEGLSVELDGSDDGYFWKFDVTEEALKGFKGSFKSFVDVDAGLSTSLKKLLKNSAKYQIFKTEHEGKLPETTVLGVKLIKELRSADELYLYYWNSAEKQVEEVNANMFREGNYLCMELDHCSTYIITDAPISGAVEAGVSVTTPVVSVDKANPETGASDFVGVATALAVVSVMGVVALNKRK